MCRRIFHKTLKFTGMKPVFILMQVCPSIPPFGFFFVSFGSLLSSSTVLNFHGNKKKKLDYIQLVLFSDVLNFAINQYELQHVKCVIQTFCCFLSNCNKVLTKLKTEQSIKLKCVFGHKNINKGCVTQSVTLASRKKFSAVGFPGQLGVIFIILYLLHKFNLFSPKFRK